MSYCKKCNHELVVNAMFCGQCGEQVLGEESSAENDISFESTTGIGKREEEKIVEVIWDLKFRTFPETQIWDIYMTTERIFFHRPYGLIVQTILGGLGGKLIFNSLSERNKKKRQLVSEMSVSDILTSNKKIITIDEANCSCISIKDKSINITLPGGKHFQLTTSVENIRRIRETINSYEW